jgi:hypothetical protein
VTTRIFSTNPAGHTPEGLLTCNIYITAGSPDDLPTLMSLLRKAQDACDPFVQAVRKNTLATSEEYPEDENFAAVVHVYVDQVYNRTSFHIAGHADVVVPVVSELAIDAVQTLRFNHASKIKSAVNKSVEHPNIGLVDHIAFMPIVMHGETDKPKALKESVLSAGWAARQVGERITEELGMKVFYYGLASPKNTPLAEVRKEQTNFFKSGSLSDGGLGEEMDACTIGAVGKSASCVFTLFWYAMTNNNNFD